MPAAEAFFGELRTSYLQGLMWCLAYYVKGCISWTWYFPYHYGPMLQDMRGLVDVASRISFEIGQPFRPFQQLLGCLPPASKALLPRIYQYLMTSEDSPLIEYYPMDFGIDQDGKKNPWEAVVLLAFIDERRLVAAEAQHCREELLSSEERLRNTFGKVPPAPLKSPLSPVASRRPLTLTLDTLDTVHHTQVLSYLFDPNANETYFSCNPEIGLPDVPNCQSVMSESYPNLAPGAYFRPELVPGTISPLAGFPTLGTLRMQNVETDFFKINVFGSDSKYRSIVLELEENAALDPARVDLRILVGRVVYVNYPQMHEAKVMAVTTETEEHRAVWSLVNPPAAGAKGKDKAKDAAAAASAQVKMEVVTTKHDAATAQKWRADSADEGLKYVKVRGSFRSLSFMKGLPASPD